MKLFAIYILILFTFYGCTYIVGRNCNYQSTKGMAFIKNKTSNICTAQFTPKKVNYDIEFTCSNKIEINKSYKAIFKKAIHSSCTPVILNLIKETK